MLETILETAAYILKQNPAGVVRYRLLRDVLKKSGPDPELQLAKKQLDSSCQVQDLVAEQWPDGSWGAFHSRRSDRRQKIPTTETAVERALALGIDYTHPALQQSANYILDVMEGKKPFPDTREKNNRWPTGMRLFLASTLARIQPELPSLDSDKELWLQIAKRTFQSGRYNEEDEIQAHYEMTGATVKGSYLVLSGKYQLNILGTARGLIPDDLEDALLEWLWTKPDGIGYLSIPLNLPPHQSGPLDRWLASHELLVRCFPAWSRFAQPSLDWLWNQRDEQGFWDFGPRSTSCYYFPLSDDWRKRPNRQVDWTTRILILLRMFYD